MAELTLLEAVRAEAAARLEWKAASKRQDEAFAAWHKARDVVAAVVKRVEDRAAMDQPPASLAAGKVDGE